MKRLIIILTMLAAFVSVPAIVPAAECPGTEQHSTNPDLRTGNTATDPVCGMEVKTRGAKYVYEYKGKKYFFCAKEYLDKFKKDPEKYIKKPGN